MLTRPGSSNRAKELFGEDRRVDILEADYTDPAALASAVSGIDAVVSAVSGTRPVIVDTQRALLSAAVSAGVPRFIPSDYSADYRRITVGSNRNFELRREFAADLDAAPIRATSVLNGAFMDMLTGQAPIVLFGRRASFSGPPPIRSSTSPPRTTSPALPHTSRSIRMLPASSRLPATA
ncbi:NmrA family NAD(P)-binding protein [Pseudarthrobacter sp. So.54]